MTATLTDRYVDAVIRRVPEAQRGDVARELHGSIADQIEARVANGDSASAAEHAVLTELGDPERLAFGFADRSLFLIGPLYFLTWKRLLVLLLWIVLPTTAIGVAIAETLDGEPFGVIVGTVVVTVLQAAVHLGFWVTAVFAVLERTVGAMPELEWTLDSLPEKREPGATFAELVVGLVYIGALAGWVFWDATIGSAWITSLGDGTGDGGEWTSILNPTLWPWWIAALLVLLAARAVLAIVVHVRREWTLPTALINAAFALIGAVPTLWLLARNELLNPVVIPALTELGAEDLFSVVPTIIGFAVVLITLWDIFDGFRRARR